MSCVCKCLSLDYRDYYEIESIKERKSDEGVHS